MVLPKQYLGCYCECNCQLALHSMCLFRASSPNTRQKPLCCSSAFGVWTNLLERSCLCLLPEQPLLLLLLLLLQEFHLEQLLLRCDCVDRGGLHHGARASLQHVRQGLFRISWNKGACWIQSGTT